MEHTCTQQQNITHVCMIPTPGLGHLIPLVELAKRLVLHQNINVTFFITTDNSPMKPQKSILQSLPNSINSVFLPPVSFNDLPENSMIESRIILSLTRSLPALRDSLKVLTQSTYIAALVVDLFGMEAFTVAEEFGISPYIFLPTNAMALSLIFYFPQLDETFSCEFRDLTEPIKLPGCVPVHGRDLPSGFQDRKDPLYGRCLHNAKRYSLASGILVNSFLDLEPGAFKALRKESSGYPPVYPIGPLINTGLTGVGDGSECLNWLNDQPSGSVLFVSFGSGGTLSHEQLNELAMGLELSAQRFLWVVKIPHQKSANATYFNVQTIKDPFDFLPKGFFDRTKGLGLLVPSWAPQIEILSHGSTGGFLTHCGWNSILESIVHGVPLIAWPLYAEQFMNAVMLTEDLKVGLRVKPNENGIVVREEIAESIRGLIEGEEGKLLRSKMGDLKASAAMVLSQDGSSTESLAEVAQIWMNQKRVTTL